jgi:CBS domain containing-hemolysin-like protein
VIWLVVVVILLMAFGSVLAMAEAALTRMNRVRALALEEEERRHAVRLVQIESDPPSYLNAIYLAVMIAQNGSAILVAFLAERYYNSLGITLVSVAFTLLYFIVVEAMSKTFAVLHSDRVALAVSPLVVWLARILRLPTKVLIGIANILLPGKGLRGGPFVSEEEIRAMAEAGHEEGAIEEEEKELIHSIFEFGDTVVREVMTPEPDVVAVDADASLDQVQDLVIKHGFSRIPVYRASMENVLGIVYAKDVLRELRAGRRDRSLDDLARKGRFVPESKKVTDLLKEMQREKFHMALVVDEYGSVTGLVTLEDLLEEIVGEIVDEYDREDPNVEPAGDGRFRVNGRLPVDELNDLLDVDLPQEDWDSVGGLMMGILGRVPSQGQRVEIEGIRFTAEQVKGRRIAKVLVEKLPESERRQDAGERR